MLVAFAAMTKMITNLYGKIRAVLGGAGYANDGDVFARAFGKEKTMDMDRVCECSHIEDDHNMMGFRHCCVPGCDCECYLQDDDFIAPRGTVASETWPFPEDIGHE